MSDNPYRVSGSRDGARRCLYCGEPRSAADVACARCHVEAAPLPGNEVPTSAQLVCPRCPTAALTPFTIADGGVTVRECLACRGCFVSERDWTELLDRVATLTPVDGIGHFVPLPPGRASPAMTELLRCPACALEMDRAHFGGPGSGVVIDICQTHGVWLDATEIVGAVRTFARMQSGESIEPTHADGTEPTPAWKLEMISRAARVDAAILADVVYPPAPSFRETADLLVALFGRVSRR
jgi:Zn-finger nucleic acid-binding protein